MSVPYCQHCKATVDLLKNSSSLLKSGEIRQRHICRTCNTARIKKYRTTAKGKISVKNAVAKYESNHPERVHAWSVRRRVKAEPCVICGAAYIHRHHPDVTRPNYIVFLCPKHHKEAHKSINIAHDTVIVANNLL